MWGVILNLNYNKMKDALEWYFTYNEIDYHIVKKEATKEELELVEKVVYGEKKEEKKITPKKK